MSSPNQMLQITGSNNFLSTASEQPPLDDVVLDIIHGQQHLVRPHKH
jgi:hypothetical protein